VLTTKGYIKFFRNIKDYQLPQPERSKFGYMCVEAMLLTLPGGQEACVLPTHFKCSQSGMPREVENPNIWIYQEEEHEN
jgi:hypothetical protein